MTKRDAGAKALGEVVRVVLAYRGHSPESLAKSYAPAQPPLSARTVRRVGDADDEHVYGDEGDLKLLRLAGMLRLPLRTLIYVRERDAAALREMDFGDEADVRAFVLEAVAAVDDPPRNRRATDKKRASR